jgi:hypothetical protein
MTKEELLKSVDWIKTTMIAVATGGPRINEVKAEFGKKLRNPTQGGQGFRRKADSNPMIADSG